MDRGGPIPIEIDKARGPYFSIWIWKVSLPNPEQSEAMRL